MADKYQTLVAGKATLIEGTEASTGVAEAGDLVALDSTGKLDASLLPTGVGPDVKIAVAGENLDAGDYINLYDNGGTLEVRKADNSNNRPAHGWVKSAVTAASNATVFFEGPNDSVSGKTIGARQYLGTAGDTIETPLDPATNGGDLHQFIGIAISATEVNTDIDDCILL